MVVATIYILLQAVLKQKGGFVSVVDYALELFSCVRVRQSSCCLVDCWTNYHLLSSLENCTYVVYVPKIHYFFIFTWTVKAM